MAEGPLSGLRVLELATGVAGPYAGRLLAMLGATVCKVEPPGGDPARSKQVDDEPLDGLSPLYVHLNAGKVNAPVAEPGAFDVVINDHITAAPLLVTVTPFGAAGESGSIEHYVLAQARAGLIGVQGDPGRQPLRLPGWQAQYQAGAIAAVGALAALRMPGVRHVDVSWTACLMTGCELHFADGLTSGRRWAPTGPFPVTAFPGGALPCRDGHVVPGSFRDIDWHVQCALYDVPEWIDDPLFATRAARGVRIDEVWARIREWYATKTKQEIFDLAMSTPWTVGKVMTGTEALADEHLAARDFIGTVTTPEGDRRAPVRPFRTAGLPVADQRVRAMGESMVPGASAPVERPPLAGLRLLEVTTAWA